MYNSIWKRILHAGEQHRHRIFIFPNLTFSELLERVDTWHHKPKPWNNRVVVSSPTNTPEFIVELLSIWKRNYVPCLIPDYYNKSMKRHCIDLLNMREAYPDKREGLVLFTTGTSSGKPKGVRLSAENVVRQMQMLEEHVPRSILDADDRTLSMMPWYHSYGLCELLSVIDRGCSTLPHTYTTPASYWLNLQYCQPNVLFTVPRLLEMIKNKIESSPVLYGSLSQDVLRAAWFGKSIRHIISGGAALRSNVKIFYNDRMEIPIYTGYGCTEMAPMISLETSFDLHSQHAGQLLPHIWVEDRQDGVIAVNGPNRFMGYLGEPLLDATEYYNTGDIGFHKNGRIYIQGRQSNTVKLSNGKFINLSEIELVLKDQFKTDQVCVLRLDIDQDPVAVVFGAHERREPEYKRLEHANIILKVLRVPSSWLTKDMISLKGEFLKHEIVKMLKTKWK